MPSRDFTSARWRKSSRSTGNGGACVEVAGVSDAIGIRDSKLSERSPIIDLATSHWSTLLRHLKNT